MRYDQNELTGYISCRQDASQSNSHNVSPVDARWPIPSAPGTEASYPAPVVEPAGSGRWMKLTTISLASHKKASMGQHTHSRGAIVGEPLAQFDKCHRKRRPGQRTSYSTQSAQFFIRGKCLFGLDFNGIRLVFGHGFDFSHGGHLHQESRAEAIMFIFLHGVLDRLQPMPMQSDRDKMQPLPLGQQGYR